jgi:hypothetical protein
VLSPKNFSIIFATCAMLIWLGLLTVEGFSQVIPRKAPSNPPRGYVTIIPCHNQLGQVWAPPSASRPVGGNEPPMLGFYQGQLVAMVFYLSENHIYPLLSEGARWNFQGDVYATADSITIAPAQFRPHRDRRAYELTVMIHHESPIAVTCAASNTPTTSQGQGGGSPPNQGGGSGGTPGGGTKKPKK